MAVDSLALPDADPAWLSHDERIGLLTEIEDARAALDALQVETLAALSRSDLSPKQWVRDEVACALRIAPVTATGKLHDARDLVELFPLACAFLADATISRRHADVLLELARGLDPATCTAVETRVLRRVSGQTVSQFRQTVRRAVASLDRRGAQEQHLDAVSRRRVVLTPQDDGTAEVWALLPADAAAHRLMSELNRCAAATRGCDDRTADQRRADALADLAALADSSGGGAEPTGPSVQVTVALTTLLELDEAPGELAGHGPIPAAMARRLAFDPTGTWRRLLTDLRGQLISVSPGYRPPAALREHVIARDRTCRFPGCRRSARSCEIDHRLPYRHGGETSEDNLHALCPRHHHLKHEASGWRVRRSRGGDTEWRTPTGRTYVTAPDPYGY